MPFARWLTCDDVMIVGTLEIQMMAGIARLQKDMADAKRLVGDATGHIEKAAGVARTALGAIGVGLSVAGLVNLVRQSIDAADRMRDMSKSTHMLVGELAGLRLLAEQSGASFEGIAKGITKMSVEIGKAPEKFAALGVTALTTKGQFEQFADIFNSLPDINQRNALAMAVFGKSWAEMAPALSEGSKKIAETIEKGRLLSGVTQEMSDRADEFNDKLAEIKTAAGGVVTRVSGDLLPTLNVLADNFGAVRNAALTLVAVKVAPWAAEAATKLYSTVAANTAKAAATLVAAQADVKATTAAVALAESRLAEMRAAAAAASGEVTLAIATNGIIPMQVKAAAASAAHAESLVALAAAQRAASLTSAAASGALALLGGPIGLITLALGLGATAWSIWGSSAKTAVDTANEEIARGLAIVKRYQKEAKFGTGDTGQLESALAAVNEQIDVLRQSSGPGANEALGEMRAKAEALQEALYKAGSATGKLTEEQKRAQAAASAFLETQKAHKDAYLSIQKHAEDLVKALQKESATYGMTDVAKKAYDANTVALTLHKGKERDAFTATTAALLKELEAKAKAAEATKKATEAEDEYAKRLWDADMATMDATKSLEQKVKAIDDETFALTHTAEQLLELNILRALEASGLANSSKEWEEYGARLREAYAANDAAKAAKAATDEIAGIAKSAEAAMHSAFIDWTSGAENAADRMWKALKTGFFDLLWNAAAKPIIVQLVTSAFSSSVATSAVGAASGASYDAAGNLISTGSGLVDAYNGFTSGTGGTGLWGKGGQWLGSKFGMGGADAANLAAAEYGGGGLGLGATEAGGTASASGGAGAMGGAAAGAAWLAAAYLVMQFFDDLSYKQEGSAKSKGNAFLDVGSSIAPTEWVNAPGWNASHPELTGVTANNPSNASGAYARIIGAIAEGDQNMTAAMAAWQPAMTKLVADMGGNSAGMHFGLGYSVDPWGKAPDNISVGVADAAGADVYRRTYDTDRGGAQAALTSEFQRMTLAAVKASGVDEIYKSFIGDISSLSDAEVTTLLGQVVTLKDAFSTLTETFADGVRAFEGTNEQVLAYAVLMHDLQSSLDADPFADYAASAELAGLTLTESLDRQRTAIDAATLAYDGSAESLSSLSQLTTAYYATALQYAQQLAEVSRSTSTMFESSIRTISMSVLDNEGKYGFLEAEITRYQDVMRSLTDPALIADYASRINDDLMAGYNLLDSAQQKATYPEFITRFEDNNQLTQDRLQASQDAQVAERAEMRASILSAIVDGMAEVAPAIAAAGSVPTPVDVAVTVTTNMPADVTTEVGALP